MKAPLIPEGRSSLRDDLREHLGKRRPTHGHHGIGHHGAHQRHRLSQKEDLHVVSAFGKRVGVMERKGGLRGIGGTPGALDQTLTQT